MKRRMVVETHSAASVCADGAGRRRDPAVNPLTALDYGAKVAWRCAALASTYRSLSA